MHRYSAVQLHYISFVDKTSKSQIFGISSSRASQGHTTALWGWTQTCTHGQKYRLVQVLQGYSKKHAKYPAFHDFQFIVDWILVWTLECKGTQCLECCQKCWEHFFIFLQATTPQNHQKYHKIGVFDVLSSKKITAHTHVGTVGILNLDSDP
jgi:hypothetical protein